MSGKNDQKTRVRRLAGCAVLVFILTIGCIGGLMLAGAILITADPLQKADAVVLLSGGDEARMDEAVRIYQDKYASTIILTETGEDLQGYDVRYSREQRDMLVDKGVPLGAIRITQKPVASTRGEAKAVRNLVAGDDNIHSIIVVTDSYHTFRARLQFKDVFKDTGIKILIRPVRGSWYRSTTWWLSARGWEATVLEYIKLAAFLLEK